MGSSQYDLIDGDAERMLVQFVVEKLIFISPDQTQSVAAEHGSSE